MVSIEEKDNRRDGLRNWSDYTHCKRKDVKVKSSLKDIMEDSSRAVFLHRGFKKCTCHCVQLYKYSKEIKAMIWADLVTTWAGSRPWRYPHNAGLVGIHHAIIKQSQRFPPTQVSKKGTQSRQCTGGSEYLLDALEMVMDRGYEVDN